MRQIKELEKEEPALTPFDKDILKDFFQYDIFQAQKDFLSSLFIRRNILIYVASKESDESWRNLTSIEEKELFFIFNVFHKWYYNEIFSQIFDGDMNYYQRVVLFCVKNHLFPSLSFIFDKEMIKKIVESDYKEEVIVVLYHFLPIIDYIIQKEIKFFDLNNIYMKNLLKRFEKNKNKLEEELEKLIKEYSEEEIEMMKLNKETREYVLNKFKEIEEKIKKLD
jgi:hypothetical protein